jgi:hypothetical protein
MAGIPLIKSVNVGNEILTPNVNDRH